MFHHMSFLMPLGQMPRNSFKQMLAEGMAHSASTGRTRPAPPRGAIMPYASRTRLPFSRSSPFGPTVTVERDGLDAEFLGEFGNRGIPALHGGLSETDLRLGEGELAAALSPSGAGGLKPGEGTLADQFALELCQGGEDAEDEAARPAWSCRSARPGPPVPAGRRRGSSVPARR